MDEVVDTKRKKTVDKENDSVDDEGQSSDTNCSASVTAVVGTSSNNEPSPRIFKLIVLSCYLNGFH